MAVNFGRLGTVTFGRNAGIVCTPESQIAAPPAPAADVTPNPTPNWVQDDINPFTNTQQILGISQNITLRLNWDNTTNIESISIYNGNPYFGGIYITTIFDNGTFTASPNQNIVYAMDYNTFIWTVNVTVTNVSDSNTVLDTFTINYAD